MADFEDRIMPCKDCGDKFMWTAGEQKFFHDKGLQNEPKRCKKCAVIYKDQLREKHPLFWLTCKKCHKKAEVPFEPKSDDVLCEECFQKEIEVRNKKITDSELSLPE